jgi:hypothetical protein
MLPPPFISIMSRAYSQLPPAGSSSARRYRQKNALQEIFALAAPIDIAAASNFISPRGLLY